VPPQPTRPDGSFNPFRGRGLWGVNLFKRRKKKDDERNFKPTIWSRPYSKEQWAEFRQYQTGDDDCNAFALAMAHNVLYPDYRLTGDEVQERIEHQWGLVPTSRWKWLKERLIYEGIVHWYLPWSVKFTATLASSRPWALNKIPGLGVPTWQYDNAVRQILPDAKVEYLTGATPEDLKRAIDDGKIAIVAVGWETNWDIFNKIRHVEQPLIGHYMVVVGYDTQQVYLLNSGEGTIAPDEWSWQRFQEAWQRGNIFIEPGSMWILDSNVTPRYTLPRA